VASELIPVYMPKYGMTMTEGTIVAWLKAEGDEVEEGEPLLSVETEKVNTDVESPASGRLVEIAVEEGTSVPVGTVIAYLEPVGAIGG